jgi:hypothetical protein
MTEKKLNISVLPGVVLAFRTELALVTLFLFALLHVVAFTIGGPFAWIYGTFLIGFLAVRWFVLALNGTLWQWPKGSFSRWLKESLVAGLVLLAAFVASGKLVGQSNEELRPDLSFGLAIFVLTSAVTWLSEIASRGSTIVFFRSFHHSVSWFTGQITAPVLSGFGKLEIVNDDVIGQFRRPPLFGIAALESVPISAETFLRNDVWRQGVASLIEHAHLFVVDVTKLTPGLSWEIDRAIVQGVPMLFIAHRGRPDQACVSYFGQTDGHGRLGTIERPLAYDVDPLSRIRFRLAVAIWMARVNAGTSAPTYTTLKEHSTVAESTSPDTALPASSSTRWYHSGLLVIGTMLFCQPIGLLLLWLYPRMTVRSRAIVTAPIVAAFILSAYSAVREHTNLTAPPALRTTDVPPVPSATSTAEAEQ